MKGEGGAGNHGIDTGLITGDTPLPITIGALAPGSQRSPRYGSRVGYQPGISPNNSAAPDLSTRSSFSSCFFSPQQHDKSLTSLPMTHRRSGTEVNPGRGYIQGNEALLHSARALATTLRLAVYIYKNHPPPLHFPLPLLSYHVCFFNLEQNEHC